MDKYHSFIKKFAEETTLQSIKIPKHVYSSNCDEYMTDVFGVYADRLKYRGYERDIVKGARVAQEILNIKRMQGEQWDIITLGSESNVKIEGVSQPLISQVKIIDSESEEEYQTMTFGTSGLFYDPGTGTMASTPQHHVNYFVNPNGSDDEPETNF